MPCAQAALISGGICVLPFPTAESGGLEEKKKRTEEKDGPLNGINLNRVRGTATR